MNWLAVIRNDLSKLQECIEYFEKEHLDARNELNPKGRIEAVSAKLAGWMEYRYAQLQEMEAILKYLELEQKKAHIKATKNFTEHYNRAISDRVAEKYADADADVVIFTELIIEFSLIRNKFLGVTKGLEILNWQIGNITRLRQNGIEDATI